MNQTEEEKFYNKVAKKFGGYAYGNYNYKMDSEYPDGNPEKDFKGKLLELKGNKKVLDVGCGDCKFAFEIAPYFSEIIGIDTSSELLKVANEKKKTLKNNNVSVFFQNAKKTDFDDSSFDIIFCRRGPTYFKEYYRLLNKGGYYLEIGIGEKDTQELQEIFGRGQGFGKWEKSRLIKNIKEFEKAGFEKVFAKDYFYDEYYATYEDLDRFLQGVPIFTDFDSEKDRKKLEEYVGKFKTPKGIRLPRHRIVMVIGK